MPRPRVSTSRSVGMFVVKGQEFRFIVGSPVAGAGFHVCAPYDLFAPRAEPISWSSRRRCREARSALAWQRPAIEPAEYQSKIGSSRVDIIEAPQAVMRGGSQKLRRERCPDGQQ